MRADRNRHAEEQRQCKVLHLGRFAETVDDPSGCSAEDIPTGAEDEEGDCHPELAIAAQGQEFSKNKRGRREQGGNSSNQPDPMKPARQPIHGPVLQFAASRCPFPRPPASGDAVLALASFGMISWVMMRGLA